MGYEYFMVVHEDLRPFTLEEEKQIERAFGKYVEFKGRGFRMVDILGEVEGIRCWSDSRLRPDSHYYLRYKDFLKQCSQSEHNPKPEVDVWWVL